MDINHNDLERLIRSRTAVDAGTRLLPSAPAAGEEPGQGSTRPQQRPRRQPWTQSPDLAGVLAATGVAQQAEGGGNALGTTELETDAVLALLAEAVDKPAVPAARYLITSAALRGRARRGHVSLECEYTVEVLAQGWSSVWLLPDSVAVTESSLRRLDSPSEEEEEDPIASLGALRAGGHGLLVNHVGKYAVQLSAMVPYSSARESGLRIDTPPMARCSLEFTVPDPGVEIKVDPARDAASVITADATTVTCALPPASFLSVQWTERVEVVVDSSDEDEAEKPPLSITCKQSTLASIGEGWVQLWSNLSYKIMNGSVQVLEVLVDPRVRVVGVECENLKRWELVEGAEESKADAAADAALDPAGVDLSSRALVRVWLDFRVEGRFELVLQSEMELEAYGDVELPSFQARGVNRESGTLGVEAITNVELRTLRSAGLTVIDVSELSKKVAAQALNPVLLAYMFLDAGTCALALNVKRHEDLDTLVAVIDRAVVTMTHTEEGRTLVKAELMVRNTQMQFLRLELPEEAEVWSASVAHEVVKPAEDGTVTMLPLRKSTTGESAKFNVEVTYMMSGQPAMGPRGHLRFKLPVAHVPINELVVNLYVPEDFTYGEFSGDMRESPPDEYLPGIEHLSGGGLTQRRLSHERNMMEEVDRMIQPQQRQLSTAGLLPVRVATTTAGRLFKFRSILVSAEPRSLAVDYRRVARPRVTRAAEAYGGYGGGRRRRCCRCVVS